MSIYANQQIVVVGAGRSGLALCDYLCAQGAQVTLSDRREEAAINGLDQLNSAVRRDLGGHTETLFVAADLIVISPGVPLDVPVLQVAKAAGVPILGEIEIATRELKTPLIAITGTNGKSTTTMLIGAMLTAWGKKTFVGGNLGTPLVELWRESGWEWAVAEISSFQLEAIERFHPRYGLLLNLSEDHLDRYPSMEAYVTAKLEIFANMTCDDVAILNADDAAVLAATADIAPRKLLFSSSQPVEAGIGFDSRDIIWRWQDEEVRFPVAELQLKGLHNIENVMAALAPVLLAGCPATIAWGAACLFGGLPHRMVPVREVGGVIWYDDSKGTNVGSVVKSLAGLQGPVTLIAGGKDKGGDYAPLRDGVAAKVAHLVLIGEATERIAETLGDLTRVHRAATLDEAVQLGYKLTPAGGSVLLSPGCSSFDMFCSYAERGERFAAAVRALPSAGKGE
ncbi:MAG: UDP-N-acetylmuramoyl-L-alanine--D-glutamate ligase [Desulfuromonas sp.]|nr:MAG: UDP-N-acetylmuramoyl-L-alanine--D-glutamate ligase [Desulfuromonas sp.]